VDGLGRRIRDRFPIFLSIFPTSLNRGAVSYRENLTRKSLNLANGAQP